MQVFKGPHLRLGCVLKCRKAVPVVEMPVLSVTQCIAMLELRLEEFKAEFNCSSTAVRESERSHICVAYLLLHFKESQLETVHAGFSCPIVQ